MVQPSFGVLHLAGHAIERTWMQWKDHAVLVWRVEWQRDWIAAQSLVAELRILGWDADKQHGPEAKCGGLLVS